MRVVLGLWLCLAGFDPARGADCAARETAASLDEAAEVALQAYASADVDGFLRGSNTLKARVACAGAPLSAPTLAAVHRALGLRAFVDRREDDAAASFRAARRLEPDFVWPDALLPGGHPARALYDRVEPDDAARPVPAPAEGSIVFDGEVGDRPVARAAVFQRLDRAGEPVDARYVQPAEPLPDYPLPAPRRGPSVALGAGAAGAAVAAGLMFGAAGVGAARYRSGEVDYADGASLRARTNALTLAGAGSAVASVGLGVGFALSGRF